MGGVFCSDKADSLPDKADTLEGKRDEEGSMGPLAARRSGSFCILTTINTHVTSTQASCLLDGTCLSLCFTHL